MQLSLITMYRIKKNKNDDESKIVVELYLSAGKREP